MTVSTLTGQFDQRLDLDYFKVGLVAGQRYLFKMTPTGADPVQRQTIDLFSPTSDALGYDWSVSDTVFSTQGDTQTATFAFVAPETGTFFLRATHGTTFVVPRDDLGTYSVSVEEVALDDHSDLPAQGTVLALGTPQPGAFDLRHDLDFFKLTLTAGQRVLITMNGAGATPIQGADLEIRGPDGHYVVDDSATTGAGGAKIAFVAPSAGTYQILATLGQGHGSTGAAADQGTYSIGAVQVALDDHSDLYAQGSALTVGGTRTGAFDLRHDLDFFKVTLTAGQRYLFTMNGSGGTPAQGVQMQLLSPSYDGTPGMGTAVFGPSGTLMADDAAQTENGGAKFAFVARESGVHYLRATLTEGATGTPDAGNYTVGVNSIGPDDHADIPANGTVLAIGASLPGQFDQRHDLDTFRVTLAQGQRYTFTMASSGENGIDSAMLQLIDPTGVPTEKFDFGIGLVLPFPIPGFESGATAKFVYTAETSGTYTLLAKMAPTFSISGNDTGAYTMAAASVAPDDHADRITFGTPLAIDTTVPGQFDFRKDTDYFKVELAVNQRYLFTLTPTGSPGQTDFIAMNLVPATGDMAIAFDSTVSTDPGKFSYQAGFTGTHYLRIEKQTGTDTGSYTIRYSSLALDDHSDLRAQGTVLLAGQAPANNAPVAQNGNAAATEDTPLNGTLPVATDADGDALTYAKASNPANGTVTVNANGSFTYTPNNNYNGTDSFGFTVSDGRGGSDTKTMTIAVAAVNDAPVRINAGPALQATAGQPFMYVVAANVFADADGDAITLTAGVGSGGTPLPGWLSFNAATRTLTGTPSAADVGSFELRIRGSDGQAFADDFQPFTIVAGANNPPTSANGSASVAEDAVLDGTLPTANDPDGNAVTFSRATQASHGTVTVNANGTYRYTPNSNFNGTDSFTFTVADGQGGSNTYTQTLTVTAVNDAPTGGVSFTGAARQFERLVASNTIADADGLGPITYHWLRGGAPIPGATGGEYVLTAADVGFTIGVQARYTDGGGTAESLAFGLPGTVQGPNSVPGGAGTDRLVGTDGRDSLSGAAGNDVLIGGPGSDTIDGGSGYDIASWKSGGGGGGGGGGGSINVDLRTNTVTQGADIDTLIDIEVIFGSPQADTFRGADQGVNARGDTLRGGGGNDTIDGGSGVDMAEFSGNRAGYTVVRNGNTITVTDIDPVQGGNDGTDTLIDVERLLFADSMLAFGTRAEEVARVAFSLWTPAIIEHPSLFAIGYSFYDNGGYTFEQLCSAALFYWPQQGRAFVDIMLGAIPASTKTADQLMAEMARVGGGDPGKIAALTMMAFDPAVTDQLVAKNVAATGLPALHSVVGFGTLFQLWPGEG